MTSQVNVKIKNREGKTLGLKLPVKYTFAELSTAETGTPGTLAAMNTALGTFLALFQGANKVQDGNFAGWTIGFSTPVNATPPTIQTHEERVVITYECQFPNAVTKLATISVPTPDLVTDFPFPAGSDRIYWEDIQTDWSAFGQDVVTEAQTWILTYGFDGVTTVTPLYADLNGGNV